MRTLLLAAAALPLTGALASLAAPVASAQTVIERETVVTRDAPAPVVEHRYYRAPPVRYYAAPPAHYYRAPGEVDVSTRTVTVTRGGCGWLYDRARETDSDYWWDRYDTCRGD